jgi:hypothetical protein
MSEALLWHYGYVKFWFVFVYLISARQVLIVSALCVLQRGPQVEQIVGNLMFSSHHIHWLIIMSVTLNPHVSVFLTCILCALPSFLFLEGGACEPTLNFPDKF